MLEELFGKSLMLHLYAVPLTFIAGAALGYWLRGFSGGDEKKPPKPIV